MNRYSVSELLTLFMVNTHKPTLVLQGVNLLNHMNFIENAPNIFYLPSSLLILKKLLKNSVVTLNNSENAVPLVGSTSLVVIFESVKILIIFIISYNRVCMIVSV